MRTVIIVVTTAVLAAACSGEGPAATTPVPVDPTVAPSSTLVDPEPAPSTTGSPSTTDPGPAVSTTQEPSTAEPEPAIPAALGHLEAEIISVGGVNLFVVVAENSTDVARGLMEIDDLGPLDGMLFVYDRDQTGSFWMFQVPIPLDIVWFDAAGQFVSASRMVPCETDSPTGADCESYSADGRYRYALEMAAGDLAALGSRPALDLASLG